MANELITTKLPNITDLNKSDKLALLAELIGFEVMPVDIDTFIEDDYYLGKLTDNGKGVYQIWREALRTIYPDPINTHTFVAFNGAIRTGKSNTAKIMAAYDFYKLSCLGNNIYKFFNLMPRPFFAGIAHQTKNKAWENCNELYEWLGQSPFFIEQSKDPSTLYSQLFLGAVRSPDDFIGKNMLFFWGTELNFFAIDSGTELINAAISRIEGTFVQGFDLFIHVILDSSDTTKDATVPIFIQKHPYGRKVLQFKFAIFDAKPELYYKIEDEKNIDYDEMTFTCLGTKVPNKYYGKPRRTFRIYKGDSEIHPFIAEPYNLEVINKNTKDKIDPDKFIDAPLELLDLATANLELFLQEKCGCAVEATSQYFNSILVVPRFNIPNLVHGQNSTEPKNIIEVDFFDPNDTFIPLFKEAIDALPRDRCLFGRIDLGVTNDRSGFSIGYVQDVGAKDIDGTISYDPIIKVPIAVGISRYIGQETSIAKLGDLIQWVHSIIPFYSFTSDTWGGSWEIKQRCISVGIPFRFLSVDRSKTGYQITKNLFYRSKLDIVDNKVLKNEVLNVFDDGYQIQHHDAINAAGDIGSDSKDILDAVVGLVWDAVESVNTDVDGVMNPPLISNSQIQSYNEELMDNWVKQQRLKEYQLSRMHTYGI